MSEAIFSCACIRERLMREAIIERACSRAPDEGGNHRARMERKWRESERAIISRA